ncbi:chymotrypsinogen 2-like [Hyposmocoma kahamanoa]|uniref:chymotrypsinogen 2-like n=1 Tax=Hyposmocoma kahamanoa TaxID=1477025 RepID=UPI000E6D61B2|nr:chymotrypsinogen 2-like [Hyposmocoma kahamanoa]
MSKSSFAHSKAFVIGYGFRDVHNRHAFGKQSYKESNVMKNIDCQKIYGTEYVTPSFVCALANGGTACYGDSGGPLAYKWCKKYYLIGVTSFSPGRCEDGAPTVFVRVTAHLEWIQSLM